MFSTQENKLHFNTEVQSQIRFVVLSFRIYTGHSICLIQCSGTYSSKVMEIPQESVLVHTKARTCGFPWGYFNALSLFTKDEPTMLEFKQPV